MRINKNDLDKYVSDGWTKGRIITNKENIIKANNGRRHIWKDGICTQVYEKNLQKYLDDGWVIGRKDPTQIKPPKKNKLSEEEYKKYCEKRKQQLIEYSKTHIRVRDNIGNIFIVEKTDPRYLSGELINANKGMVATVDTNGNSHFVSVNDPRYISGELVAKNQSTKGKILIKHIASNKYLFVDKDDSRLTDSEYVCSTKGLKYTDEQREKIKKAKTKKKMTWINNGKTHKYIALDDLEEFLSNNIDWEPGRIK
jgi:hypothetical protein